MKVLTVVTVAAISGILFINSMTYISNVLAQTWYKKYGYYAVMPNSDSNNSKEVVAVKGTLYPYTNSNSSHVDRMVYIFYTGTPDLSVGAGHYEQSNGQAYYMMYFDEGLDDNYHLIATSPSFNPSNTYTAEVVKVNSSTYSAKINGSTIKSWSCNATCPSPAVVAGAVSWGTKTDTNFTVNANIWSLQLKRPADTNYQYFDSVANQSKCNENPSDLGYEKRTNQIIVDATTRHDCSVKSDVWLYRGGSGG
jgi:hypothetical protein